MDPRLAANLENWNSRVRIHTESRFYDVEGWLREAPGPPQREIEALGDVEGKTLVHLQCHFGMDTMQWARVGAVATGLDFSPAAIDEAVVLAERAGLSERTSFVCSNVYDAPQALSGKQFDVVYVSLGALCWLPNIAAWGAVVAELLAPDGRLYLHDGHPFTSCFDDDGERIISSYFEEPEDPYVSDNPFTYTDGEELGATRTYEWNHSLGEIVAALVTNGLVIDSLAEHDWSLFRRFPWLEETESGIFVIPEGRPRIPLSLTVTAHAPS
jgi:SAM-dependent methyltransferase